MVHRIWILETAKDKICWTIVSMLHNIKLLSNDDSESALDSVTIVGLVTVDTNCTWGGDTASGISGMQLCAEDHVSCWAVRCWKGQVFACVHDGCVGLTWSAERVNGSETRLYMEVVEVMAHFCSNCMCLCSSVHTYMGHKTLNAAYFRANYVSVSKIYLKLFSSWNCIMWVIPTINLHMSFYHSASVDYTPRGFFEITFPAGSTRQEYTVNIIDDFLPEDSKFFNAEIVRAGPAGVIIGEPRQPLIEILDTVDGRLHV